jgi:hypothetical protein
MLAPEAAIGKRDSCAASLVAVFGREFDERWAADTMLSRADAAMRETDLYPPIKQFLEQQGYAVKAEVGPADVVAVRGDEPPVIVELKTGFALSLFHQAIERQTVTDAVYIAVRAEPRWRARP